MVRLTLEDVVGFQSRVGHAGGVGPDNARAIGLSWALELVEVVMALQEVSFTSANGRDEIRGWIYIPVGKPKAVLQIVHGLGEHSRRYFHMINRLLDDGIVVVADDHAGHGATAKASGVWMDTGANGDKVVVDDEVTLMELAKEQYPDLPYFVLGHSWGSMIARAVAMREEIDLSGLILFGIAAGIKGIEETLDREALAAEIAEGDPTASGAKYVGAMFGDFVERYENPQTPSDWIALDPEVVADHAADPLNALEAPMSLRFVQDFIDLYDQVNEEGWAETVADDLPVLIVAGDQDPVANYGEGAYKVAGQLWDAGLSNVRTKVYPGSRHEIHNEKAVRDDVETEVVEFVNKNL